MKINKVAEAVESMEIIDKQKKVLETAKDTLKETVKKVQSDRNNRVYYGLDRLPSGMASNQITDGCLVLEGGAFVAFIPAGSVMRSWKKISICELRLVSRLVA